ncbi:antibiotic biosynthesis monooxygenase family protein [Lysobacter niastensis]|nr:antibiotic biosynthesis monooxygenase family protein [Lysobacter niastensis]
MFATVWEYEVRPGVESAFEALYGSQGAWVALFREQPGYLGTELMRGHRPGHYLTIDRWRSEQDYTAFQQRHDPRYAGIDALGDELTLSERHIGTFTVADDS